MPEPLFNMDLSMLPTEDPSFERVGQQGFSSSNTNMNMISPVTSHSSPHQSLGNVCHQPGGLLAVMQAQQRRHSNMRIMKETLQRELFQNQSMQSPVQNGNLGGVNLNSMHTMMPVPPPPPFMQNQARPSALMTQVTNTNTLAQVPAPSQPRIVSPPLSRKASVSSTVGYFRRSSFPKGLGPKQMIPLPDSFEPGPTTVVLGRERLHEFSQEPGNLRMELIAGRYLAEYSQAPSKEVKSKIVTSVVDAVRGVDGGEEGMFVKYVKGQWHEADEVSTREKVTSFFRNKLPNKYRSSSQAKHAKRKFRKMMMEEDASSRLMFMDEDSSSNLNRAHAKDRSLQEEWERLSLSFDDNEEESQTTSSPAEVPSSSTARASTTQKLVDATLDMMSSMNDEFPTMGDLLDDDEAFQDVDESDGMFCADEIFS